MILRPCLRCRHSTIDCDLHHKVRESCKLARAFHSMVRCAVAWRPCCSAHGYDGTRLPASSADDAVFRSGNLLTSSRPTGTMNSMKKKKVESLKTEALAAGYVLKPIPPTCLQTQEDVKAGFDSSRQLADKHGIPINTAHMRLAHAFRVGLIREKQQVSCSGGGWESRWMAVEFEAGA